MRYLNTHPPEIPEATRAQYFHLPLAKLVATADNSQTGRNDFEVKGAEVERLGIIKERKVDR